MLCLHFWESPNNTALCLQPIHIPLRSTRSTGLAMSFLSKILQSLLPHTRCKKIDDSTFHHMQADAFLYFLSHFHIWRPSVQAPSLQNLRIRYNHAFHFLFSFLFCCSDLICQGGSRIKRDRQSLSPNTVILFLFCVSFFKYLFQRYRFIIPQTLAYTICPAWVFTVLSFGGLSLLYAARYC